MEKTMRFLTLILLAFMGCSPAFASGNLPVGPGGIPGCVLYLSFNEGSGTTIFDHSRNGNQGTLAGTPAWVSGRNGYGLKFDRSSDDMIVITSNASLTPANVTIVMWLRVSERSYAGFGYALIRKIQNVTNASWVLDSGLLFGTTRSIDFSLDNTGNRTLRGTIPFDDFRDHVIVASYDGKNQRIYVDGRAAGVRGDDSGINNADPGDLRIGNYNGTTQAFFGTLDDVAIFNRALNDGEVAYISAFLLGRNEQAFFGTFGRPDYTNMLSMV